MKGTNKQIINSLVEGNPQLQTIGPAETETGSDFLQRISQFPGGTNIFLTALIDRVTKTEFTLHTFRNKFEKLKKGFLPYGTSIQQIFVGDVEPEDFGTVISTNNGLDAMYSKSTPPVKVDYITTNVMNMFKVTFSEAQLKNAFLNDTGLSSLVNQFIESLYRSDAIKDMQYLRYCLFNLVGQLASAEKKETTDSIVVLPAEPKTKEQIEDLLVELRATAGEWEEPSTRYNLENVNTTTSKEDLVLVISPRLNAKIDVKALAAVFNMDKADIKYSVIESNILPEWVATSYHPSRQAKVDLQDPTTGNNVGYTGPITIDSSYSDFKVDAILMDKKAVQFWDTLIETRQVENAATLSYNLLLHHHAIAGANPFSNVKVIGHKTV